MSDVSPPRRMGKPRRRVSDEARAVELLAEIGAAEFQIREATARRQELAREAHDIGLTMARIGEAAGVSHMAVSKWLRSDGGGDNQAAQKI